MLRGRHPLKMVQYMKYAILHMVYHTHIIFNLNKIISYFAIVPLSKFYIYLAYLNELAQFHVIANEVQ